MSFSWDIDEGPLDSAEFFRLLPDHLPEATTFFAEGTSISAEVEALYKSHAQAGKFLPGAQTIWPVSKKFRCEFSRDFCLQLAALAERHAEPELLDHLSIYSGTEPLLQWHDAFANAMLLSGALAEQRVKAFAGALNLPYSQTVG